MNSKLTPMIILIITFLFGATLQQTHAQSWFKAGSLPESYDMGGDPTVSHGSPGGGFIKSIESPINGFGTWMTTISPGEYLGHGIKLTAYVKTDNVANWVGLWMRVDGIEFSTSFDNMGNRSLNGTTDWEQHEIILDVPNDANQISYGILLSGTGEAMVDGLELETASRTWELQNSGISEIIYSLKAIDENTVWAGAVKGIYLRTTDGGLTWTSGTIAGAESLTLLSLAAIDANTAYFAATNFNGGDSRIYKTTDGGANWTMQYQNTSDPNVFFNAIAFWDEDNGVAVSDAVNGSFLIVRTTNGGADWNEVPSVNIPPPLPNEWAGFGDGGGTSMVVSGTDHVWFGTAYGVFSNDPVRVLRSTDQGQTWTASDTPLSNEGQFHGISTLAFKDSLTGFATSGTYPYSDSATTFVKTIDGGQTWTEVDSFLPLHPSTLVYIPNTNDSTLFVTSDQGSAISEDGGTTWTRRSTQAYRALSFASPTAGWAAWAPPGRIVKYVPSTVTSTEEALYVGSPQLMQNQPNPFHSSTRIVYILPNSGPVTLKVYNQSGQELATLVDGFNTAGINQVEWKPKGLTSGIYVYTLKTGDFSITKKLLLQK